MDTPKEHVVLVKYNKINTYHILSLCQLDFVGQSVLWVALCDMIFEFVIHYFCVTLNMNVTT